MTKMNEKERQALNTLYRWGEQNGYLVTPVNETDWRVRQYLDAYVFGPSGDRRSSAFYLVRAEKVVVFSLFQESLEEAYKRVCS